MKINLFLFIGSLCLLLTCCKTFGDKFDSNLIIGTKTKSQDIEYPIIVGTEANVKEGTEYIIESEIDEKVIYYHIVIPKEVSCPDDLTIRIIYKGIFLKIINVEKFKFKKPSSDYKYFLVESWEYE